MQEGNQGQEGNEIGLIRIFGCNDRIAFFLVKPHRRLGYDANELCVVERRNNAFRIARSEGSKMRRLSPLNRIIARYTQRRSTTWPLAK